MNPDDQDDNQQSSNLPASDDQQVHNPTQDEPVQPLPQDGDTPFSEPSDAPSDDTNVDEPALDTNVQPEEVYDGGQAGAAEDNRPPQAPLPPAA